MHKLSSLARRPWSWVRIPLTAWMFGMYMCLFCVCAVLCLGRGLAMSCSLIQGVLPIVNKSGNWKEARTHKGCRASHYLLLLEIYLLQCARCLQNVGGHLTNYMASHLRRPFIARTTSRVTQVHFYVNCLVQVCKYQNKIFSTLPEPCFPTGS
jgi:hypothetical protein